MLLVPNTMTAHCCLILIKVRYDQVKSTCLDFLCILGKLARMKLYSIILYFIRFEIPTSYTQSYTKSWPY